MGRLGLAAVVALAAAMTAGAASAQQQDPRVNPFTPPLSAAEEQARQDERMKKIFWELQPEAKNLVMEEVRNAQGTLEVRLRRRIDQAIEEATKAPAAGGAPGGLLGGIAAAAGADTKMPEGAKFISCVNGKAVYRDPKDNSIFQVAGTEDPRCAAN